METDAQRNESGNDSTEEIMEFEEFQAENGNVDEQKEEEETEEEGVEDEKDFEMEDENSEEDENIQVKEEKLVEFAASCDDSKEEWKTTGGGLLKMTTSPQKSTVSPLKMVDSPPKIISEMKPMANVSPQKMSSSPQKIKGSSCQKGSFFSQDVVAESQKIPEKLALSPSSSLSMEDSDEEEFEGKIMTRQKMTTASQKRTTSPQKITLSPSSSSMENSEEDIEGEELEADREKLTTGEEVVENSVIWIEKDNSTWDEDKKEAVEATRAISSSRDVESRADASDGTGFVVAKNFKGERDAGRLRQSRKELPEDVNKEPGRRTGGKSLEESTLIEIASSASSYSLVLEESADEEQSEKLVNRVLEFIDGSSASQKDLFEEFEGVRCEASNQQKVANSIDNCQ